MGKSPNTFSIRIEKRTTDNKTKSNRSPSSSFFRLCIRLFRSGMYSANVHHGTEFRWNPGGPLGCFISFHCRIGGSQELWHLSARAGRSSTLHWKVRKLPTLPSFLINLKMSVTAVAFKIDGSRRGMNKDINERSECEENFPFAVLRPSNKNFWSFLGASGASQQFRSFSWYPDFHSRSRSQYPYQTIQKGTLECFTRDLSCCSLGK
jgi:hypothetical protein